MNLFESILLNAILIIGPLSCYLLYLFFQKKEDKNKNDLFFDCAIFISFYLLIKFTTNECSRALFVFFDILLLISYLNNKKLISIILSVIIITYYYKMLEINIHILCIEYIIYFIVYFFNNKKETYINIFLILKTVFFNIYVCFNYNNFIYYTEFIILIILFSIISRLILKVINSSVSVSSLYKTIRTMEDDKKVRESLFKITHEIKNPIVVVKGYLDMFDINNRDDSNIYILKIKDEINRVITLLEDFLYMAEIKIVKEEMDLSMLLEDIVDGFNLILKNKNIKLIYKEIEETYIFADYNRLKQVLVNLIKNSVEAIIKKGTIKIYVTNNRNNIKIIIEDNGIGMTKAVLNNIKKVFFTTKTNGTGLGIHLSSEIIKRHNGTIIYRSIKNVGTKAIITLKKKDIKVS